MKKIKEIIRNCNFTSSRGEVTFIVCFILAIVSFLITGLLTKSTGNDIYILLEFPVLIAVDIIESFIATAIGKEEKEWRFTRLVGNIIASLLGWSVVGVICGIIAIW